MAEVLEAIELCGDDHLKARCETSIAIINRTIDLYGVGQVAFSFNGGKDSTVLLHIVRAALVLRAREQGLPDNGADEGLGGLLTFFFHSDADFPEITEFVYSSNKRYHLGMEVLHGDFKAGLVGLLQRSGVRAILLGTRKGDPNAGDQEVFCPSSPGWPAFLRVNPMLHWSYYDVWGLLGASGGLPYCELYDRGFTSIGSVANTEPNSALLRECGGYAPAHMLPDARLERAGRLSRVERRTSTLGGRLTKTAGLVIIGDEILSAKVDDTNSPFLCRQLRSIGWRVCRVAVVPDDVASIAAEVAAQSEAHDVVLTSGGLGPTPDDVTMQAIAEAFGRRLGPHPELDRRIRAYFGGDVTPAHLKMADAPSGSEVVLVDFRLPSPPSVPSLVPGLDPAPAVQDPPPPNGGASAPSNGDTGGCRPAGPRASIDGRGSVDGGSLSPFPLVRVRNVYVLPGIPALLRKKWQAVRDHLLAGEGAQLPFRTVLLRLNTADETVVAGALGDVGRAAAENVAVGSYPVTDQVDGAELVLSLESKDCEALDAAVAQLRALLPAGALVSEHRDTGAVNCPVPAKAPV